MRCGVCGNAREVRVDALGVYEEGRCGMVAQRGQGRCLLLPARPVSAHVHVHEAGVG
jgi:hypothetical protein